MCDEINDIVYVASEDFGDWTYDRDPVLADIEPFPVGVPVDGWVYYDHLVPVTLHNLRYLATCQLPTIAFICAFVCESGEISSKNQLSLCSN